MQENIFSESTLAPSFYTSPDFQYLHESVPLAYAVIPARGGSKGFPGKNIAMLQGKPLIAHTILQAQRAEFIKEVIVSTEDEDIAAVSEEWGATVVERPEELAHDFSPSEDALQHVIEYMKIDDNSLVVMLQCTSPIRRSWMIDNAIEMVAIGDYDSVLSAVKLHQFVWSDRGQGAYSLNYDPVAGMRPMRQSVDEYVENGSIYVFSAGLLRRTGKRLGGKIGIYDMPYWSRFEIDQPDDLDVIEWILSREDMA